MGFAGYFLIVWDLIRFAREQGIRVGPGRGSAAGSVVSYALRITDLDPLRYGLLFERFLNPERIQMPDIDMDFDERRRDEVIRYATERYGSDHVAQIVTFQTIKGKQGIRDAARVLGFPPVVRRPALQDVPAGGDGARRADREGALSSVARAPRRVREGARGPRGHRHRARARGPAPRGLRPRGRGRHRRRAARELPAAQAHEGLARRLEEDRDPVRHGRGRAARPAEDGLPRAADALRDRGDPASPAGARRRARHRRTCRSTTRRPTRCCGAATRRACSRWSRPGCAT